jgi:pyruvate/2-oxoglutarate dehydrogenase complex dihydrolipoamide dehydrogenase (E3) component
VNNEASLMHEGGIYPIIVVGAGAGGLVVAIGAAKAGKKVLLIEKGNYGGDCTNFGCIPSKSLIAAAHAAHYMNSGRNFGIKGSISGFETQGALDRTRHIVEEVRKHENPEALAAFGVDTLTGTASFKDPHTLQVRLENGELKTATGKNLVIATGSYPYIPKIEGIESCTYLTNETIFNLKQVPRRLGVIGGGPIGSELAQAFHRLGAHVTIIQHGSHLLKKEEVEAQKVIEEMFIREGIVIKTNCETLKARSYGDAIQIAIRNKKTKSEETIEIDHLLISTGRRPNIETLNLDAIRIKTHKRGIMVDAYGRTTQKHIWAVGDATGRALFTHIAENEARTVLKNLLLPWPLRFKQDRWQAIPRVTYTDPEIASVGLSEKEALSRYGSNKIAVYHVPFSELDRAITTARTEGFVKIITKKWSSKILGATIASPRAGEMLNQITLAMKADIPLRKLASLIHPYPSYSLAIRKAADQWLTKTIIPSLFKFIGR